MVSAWKEHKYMSYLQFEQPALSPYFETKRSEVFISSGFG